MMAGPIEDYYVLFHNHTEGLQLYKAVRERNIKVQISPAPRAASVCCGMSLLVMAEDIEKVRSCIAETNAVIDSIVRLPRQIDPKRDKYC